MSRRSSLHPVASEILRPNEVEAYVGLHEIGRFGRLTFPSAHRECAPWGQTGVPQVVRTWHAILVTTNPLVMPVLEVNRRLLAAPGQVRSTADRILMGWLKDERDLPVMRLFLLMTVVLVPLAVAMYAVPSPPWWLVVATLGAGQYFSPPYILALHVSSHRGMFKQRARWMQGFVVWVLGPLVGQTPETYRAHHMGMHHSEENLENDLSSTMPYQRDRFSHWLHYYGRFMFCVFFELSAYMIRRKRYRLLKRIWLGECLYLAAMVGLFFVNWQATLVVFGVRFVLTRFGLMAGNWTQHAFIDPADPGNPYKNSVTLIDTSYNRMCFNDGFHAGHHLKPNRHWSEMADDFEKNLDRYAEEEAVVFRGVDYFVLWLWLMLKRYDWMAERLVVWPGQDDSKEAKIRFIRSRLKPVPARAQSSAPAAA